MPACHTCTLLRRSAPSALSGAAPPPCSGVASGAPQPQAQPARPTTAWQASPLTRAREPRRLPPSPSRAASHPRLAGFPLTQVPEEYRALLQQGLVTTYVINAAAAVYSLVSGVAAAKQEPAGFWFGKILLLGGLALGELREIEAPDTRKKFPNQK